jgi:hypothetical protein
MVDAVRRYFLDREESLWVYDTNGDWLCPIDFYKTEHERWGPMRELAPIPRSGTSFVRAGDVIGDNAKKIPLNTPPNAYPDGKKDVSKWLVDSSKIIPARRMMTTNPAAPGPNPYKDAITGPKTQDALKGVRIVRSPLPETTYSLPTSWTASMEFENVHEETMKMIFGIDPGAPAGSPAVVKYAPNDYKKQYLGEFENSAPEPPPYLPRLQSND